MRKVLITPRSFRESGEKPYRILNRNGCEVLENTTGKTLSEEQMTALCKDMEGLIVGIDPVTRKVLENAPKLKAISKYGAGLDNIDLAAAAELGIEVRSAAGTNAVSVAELAVGLFFTLARNIVPAAISTKNGKWDRRRGVEVRGKTVGILGLGNIGREVARMSHGLGMNILAYDPFANPSNEYIRNYEITLADQAEVIQEADFLTLHLPLMEETKKVINTKTLAMMKRSAYLINTSRGELVDEGALCEFLTSGLIAGAASDVFSKEPPGEHPLLKLDNFILTSHIGAYTAEANQRMAEVSARNLLEMLGEKINQEE